MIDIKRAALRGGVLAIASTLAHAQGPPPGFQETVVWANLSNPTAVRFAPDGHVFVAEKSGVIKVFHDVEDHTSTTFADLSAQVYDTWDRGLLGLAIDPGFPAHPYIYVLYAYDYLGIQTTCTDLTGNGCMARGRVSRLTANVTGEPVMTGAELVLIEDWCQQFPSHSVGDLCFGLDGALYVSGGDGASFNFVDYGQVGNPCGDPPNAGGALRSQDLRTSGDPTALSGTILRIDPATGAALPDDPLYGGAVPDDDRIIAYGLRNPFRITVRPGTLEVWIGDVGWGTWEEIDVVRDPLDSLVENFGWPCYEGTPTQSGYDGTNLPICESLYAQGASAVVAPHYSYPHPGGASITGITFYEASRFPSQYAGALFFADYSERWIKVMYLNGSGEPDPSHIDTFRSDVSPVDLQLGPNGDLYYVNLGSNQVRRIEYYLGNQPPVAVARANATNGPAPLLVQFDGSDSFDPDAGDLLGYAWDLDADGAFDDSTLIDPQYTYTAGGNYVVKLRVSDDAGLFDVDQVLVSVDNTPPIVTILAPVAGETWRVGDVLTYQGTGDDPETGALPAEALDWKIVMLHCAEADPDDCHEHAIEEVDGQSQGQFVAVDHEYPCHLELRLTGTDPGAGNWWNASWNLRQRLSFDNGSGGADLVDFPVLVRLDPTRLEYSQVSANGADLRFVSEDGSTQLSHQIESWNPLGVSVVWVRVPHIAAGSTTGSMWMYYSNAAAGDGQSPAAVWAAGYAGVWHLDSSLVDSTANANNGANFGSLGAPGKFGEARSFDGSNDWIDCGSGASLAITGQLTVEGWVKIANSQLDSAMRILSKKNQWSSTHGYNLEHQPLENTVTTLGSGSDYGRASGINLDTSTWHHLAATIQGSTARVYVDGVDATTDSTVSALIASSQALHIGRRSGGGDYFYGLIDEVRISNVARSREWNAAQFRSMSDTFVSFGVPQDAGSLSATTTLALYPETKLVQFASRPSGLELVAFGDSEAAPFTREAILNGTTTISAPSPQIHKGRKYYFRSWSDGGAQTHTIVIAEGGPPLVATYLPVQPRVPR